MSAASVYVWVKEQNWKEEDEAEANPRKDKVHTPEAFHPQGLLKWFMTRKGKGMQDEHFV